MDELITLKTFNTYIEASGLVELLDKNGIPYFTMKTESTSDVVFAGNTLDEELQIKVKSENFEAAQKLLEELVEVDAEKLEKDYYLFEFTDNELLEILQKPDEWSLNDYRWAQEILKQRGQEVAVEKLDQWKKERLELLSKPEIVTSSYLRNSYMFCILGGFVGYFMGRHLYAFRKLLPNGKKVYAFDEASRQKGKKIELIGLVCFLAYIILFTIMIIR